MMSCPICHKPTNPTYEPFCSKHCKNTDLLNWFHEDYRIPTQEEITSDREDDVPYEEED